MADTVLFSLEALPDAAAFIDGTRVADANALARHYLPQLEPGAALPAFLLPLTQPEAMRQGTFTVGSTRYAFRLSPGPEGMTLLSFHPAPQAALTDTQLDGVLRQIRTFMSDFMVEAECGLPEAMPAFRKSIHRMFRMVENLDLLRLTGAQEGAPFRPVTMDLAGLCRQICDQAAPLLAEREITLEYHSDLISLLLPGDPALLQRLVLELIANAAQAAGKGTIQLRLRRQGDRAVLVLGHSGNLPSQRQISAMLQQDSDHLLPMAGSGAGLGLAVVRHIADLHKGSLLVEWSQGAPTTILTLPTGPLAAHTGVQSPNLQRDGGMSPLLVALSDVLPVHLFADDDLV